MLGKKFSTCLRAVPIAETGLSAELSGTVEASVRRVAILVMLYLIPSIWIVQPVINDPDIWWHLRTGQWIVEHGTLPTTDPFSIYGENRPWFAYSWLFEISLYGLFRSFGESGIILYTLMAVWVVVYALHRIVSKRISDFALICGVVAISTITLSKLFTPRPWLLTIIFCAATLEVVLSLREGRLSRWFYGLPVLYVLWANVHIQFVYGLGLLGLACIAPYVDRIVAQVAGLPVPVPWRGACRRQLVTITAMCGIATLLTPYHIHLYRVVVELAGQTGMWDYAQEMLAPSFRTLADWTMLAMCAAAIYLLGRRAAASSFEVVLLLVGGLCAFRGQRDSWLLVLAVIVVVVSPRTMVTRQLSSALPRRAFAMAIVLVVAATLGIARYREYSTNEIRENTAKQFPVAAAAFVEDQGFGGPLYNHFNWGGYLSWRLPHLKVSMDGRANIHGDERIKRSISTWSGESKWIDDEELGKAALVIAQREFALASLLRRDPRFRLVHQDDTADVFVRSTPDTGSEEPNLQGPVQQSQAIALVTENASDGPRGSAVVTR